MRTAWMVRQGSPESEAIQLEMFGSIAPIVLRPTGKVWELSAGLTICRCGDECELVVVGTVWKSGLGDVSVWGNECCDFVCAGDHIANSYDSGPCGNCNACYECCECSSCDECSESVSELVACGTCADCCSCTICLRCDTHGNEGNSMYACEDCDRCPDCCDCIRCGYCSEISDAVCDRSNECRSCCENGCYDEKEPTETLSPELLAQVPQYVAGDYSAVTPYTFGVELEHAGITRGQIADALDYVGLGHSGWRTVEDGSLDSGYECVSPILRGDDGFRQMRTAMLALAHAGGTVNVRCGTHVHIGADDMEATDIIRLVRFYNRNHSVIDMVHTPSRRGFRSYTSPTTESEMSDMDRAATHNELANTQHGRYRSVNVDALRKHGTIEFRQHAGTLDPDKLSAWVRMLFAMCNAARFGLADGTYATVGELLTFLVSHGLPMSDADYLTKRALVLADA